MRRLAPVVGVSVVVALLGSATSVAQVGPDVDQSRPEHEATGLEAQLHGRATERERAERDLAETREAEGTARERLAAADAELDRVTSELAEVEAALAAATAARDEAREEAGRLRTELAAVQAELAETEAELAVVQERYEARVAGAFKRGGAHNGSAVVQQLLTQEDIADALAVRPFLSAVMDADRRVRDEVREVLGDVEAQRAEVARLRVASERELQEADRAAAEVERRVEEQATLTAAVAAQREAREAALVALQDDREAIESHLAGLDAESGRIASQLAAIAAEQAAQEAAAQRAAEEAARQEAARREAEAQANAEPAAGEGPDETAGDGSGEAPADDVDAGDGASEEDGSADAAPPPPPPPPGGGWTRPSGGPVTSPFGPRWGRNHNGVDIGGAVGTGVVASRAGTVVGVTASCHPTSSFGCGGGFGNHVVVSHDGGMGTIYAHLSSVAVGVGQQVGAGQGVGAIGNSGNSYGAHLHFEVRHGGSPVDPCGYIAC